MAKTENKFVQKPYSKLFTEQAKALVESGKTEYKSIAEQLEWSDTSLSLVVNGKRDIPFDKWETFQKLYIFEIDQLETNEPLDEVLRKQKREIIWLKASTLALTEKIAELISKSHNVSVSSVITAIENDTKEIATGRLSPLKKKQ